MINTRMMIEDRIKHDLGMSAAELKPVLVKLQAADRMARTLQGYLRYTPGEDDTARQLSEDAFESSEAYLR